MATTQYIGARYVPILADPVEWSNTKSYEPLTIVTHEGNSYTSRQFVPQGIDISNEIYWALTGNYNAQIEQYRRETAQAVETTRQITDDAVSQVETWLTEAQDTYGAKPFAFDTVEEMQNHYALLYEGAICHTNGFRASGDGGAAWYVIGTSGPANNMDVLACGNLFATLIVDNLCIEMLGSHNSNVADSSSQLLRAMELSNVIYLKSEKLRIENVDITGKNIIGNGNTTIYSNSNCCFKITSTTEITCVRDISFFINENIGIDCVCDLINGAPVTSAAVRTIHISNCNFVSGTYRNNHYGIRLIGCNESIVSYCVARLCNLAYVDSSINVTFESCIISRGYYGINISTSGEYATSKAFTAGVRIINTNILGCYYGIYTYSIDNCIITGCMIDYNVYSIYTRDTVNPEISNCYISAYIIPVAIVDSTVEAQINNCKILTHNTDPQTPSVCALRVSGNKHQFNNIRFEMDCNTVINNISVAECTFSNIYCSSTVATNLFSNALNNSNTVAGIYCGTNVTFSNTSALITNVNGSISAMAPFTGILIHTEGQTTYEITVPYSDAIKQTCLLTLLNYSGNWRYTYSNRVITIVFSAAPTTNIRYAGILI